MIYERFLHRTHMTVLSAFVWASIAVPLMAVEKPSAKPNILFIMVDDLGKDWISCYGAGNNADTDDDGDGYSDLLESLAGGNRLLSTDHDKTKTFLMGYGLYASKDVNELTAPARLLGRNDVISDPSQYGLFNEGSLGDLRKDALFITKNSQGDLIFDYQIQASEDLENWIVLENLQYKVTPSSDKEFLRVRVSNEWLNHPRKKLFPLMSEPC
jgi:hypothetical protein